MANIKISELNELLEGDRAYDDYLPIVDSSANETKKVSVKNLIPNNVELIAVTDTAPTSFGTGDKYYNTTTNRIYTARSGEWISPEEPIKGILYIILEEQKSYTYDGTTLISVGGGAGGIVVYPNIPDEDTQLYIEEEDLDGQYLPVEEDIYSTTETKTNKVWIDGKPIYRRVFNSNTAQTFTSRTSGITLGTIANISEITNMQLFCSTGGSTDYILSYLNNMTLAANNFNTSYINNFYINVRKSTGVITLARQAGSSLPETTTLDYYSLVIEYTKN